MKIVVVMLTSILLTGCAGISYVADNYKGEKSARVESYGKKFDIWDVPEQRKMLISATVGDAIGIGLSSGLTFGATSSQSPERIYRMAGEEYLGTAYKQSCEIENIEFVVKPQYEAFYLCNGDNKNKIIQAREDNFAEIERKKLEAKNNYQRQ